MGLPGFKRRRERPPAFPVFPFDKDLLALSTGISSVLAVSYLWVYLGYIGRPDLLLPSLGNAGALLVLFAMSMFYFPLMALLVALPAILMVTADRWARRLDPGGRITPPWLAAGALSALGVSAALHLVHKGLADPPAYWRGAWLELLAPAPFLVWFGLRRLGGAGACQAGRPSTAWFRAGMAGLLAWLLALALGVPASQALKGDEPPALRLARALALAACALVAGLLFMRWRRVELSRARMITRLTLVSALLVVASLCLSPRLFERTMKKVAYSTGMRDKSVGLFLVNAPFPASSFDANWGACATQEEGKVLVWGRKMFAFGDTLLICPGNYEGPTSKAMRRCAAEECMALSAKDAARWIAPRPGVCPPMPVLPDKVDGCRDYRVAGPGAAPAPFSARQVAAPGPRAGR
ncbi:hypothetical protein [Massilia sp. ST3]|uniref:hypothetical protein n=1 Tax=Massilia sp. ST3 TaxID=2824903 RepID=UPI001B81C74A|nr:hypothetical protein [Massilia sp. ST3]MBQ5946746.1 hypothetical protein [Massilia sp. ST3]